MCAFIRLELVRLVRDRLSRGQLVQQGGALSKGNGRPFWPWQDELHSSSCKALNR